MKEPFCLSLTPLGCTDGLDWSKPVGLLVYIDDQVSMGSIILVRTIFFLERMALLVWPEENRPS